MRVILTLIVGIGLAAGAYYLSKEAGLSKGVSSEVTIVYGPEVDLVGEIDKLPEGAKPIIRVPLGENLQDRCTQAFIEVPEGGTILLDEGKYELNNQLQIRTPSVTIRGAGQDKTILNFAAQLAGTGGEGLLVKANDFLCEDLTIEETKGDAVKVEGSTDVVFRRVSTLWHNDGNSKNGAYGLYPVTCKNVLLEYCVAEGASDAGIYVGQSENIIVRHCRAEKNVAGIEIENSKNADVYENVATNNTGGILIFDLPGLPAGNGGGHRVYKNKVYENNHPNFAPEGNIVASVPQGTGVMVMATDDVEVFENEISDNQSYNTSIISFLFTGRPVEDEKYDPIPERISIHSNKYVGGGNEPMGSVKLLGVLIGTPIPDIVYDGMAKKSDQEGAEKAEQLVFIDKNNDADFVNLRFDLVKKPEELLNPKNAKEHISKIERDIAAMGGEVALRTDAVKLEVR